MRRQAHGRLARTARKSLWVFALALTARVALGEQSRGESIRLKPDATRERDATKAFAEFPLPHPNSGPTTIALAPDGTVWFTEQGSNRIGRMAPDGTGLEEFELPHAGSAPRIITIGADNNFWFTEHLGNRIGRITADASSLSSTSLRPTGNRARLRSGATATSGSANSPVGASAASRRRAS
jgi:streptogramin lyase